MRTILALFTFYLSFAFVFFGANGIAVGEANNDLERRASFRNIKDYIRFEYPVALRGLFANIGSDGSKSQGALPGVVIASPSTSDPDYLFTWIRDSSLVYKHIIDRYVAGRDDSLLFGIQDWVASMGRMQQTANPSGNVTTGGLGEPKFMIDETAFTGAWGRPQRDGPALRATAILRFANHLLDHDDSEYVTETLLPILKLDLNYVATMWNATGFDLWEELNAASFFTSAAQHRSLREGVTLATRLGGLDDSITYWQTQADNILCFLQTYWSDESGFIVANVDPGYGPVRTGIDSNTVLASIHTYDPAAGCDPVTFQPCSDKALASLKVYVDSFRAPGVYAINNGVPATKAIATGRYADDVYFEGNPWYLSTFAVAEQLYRAIEAWQIQGDGIEVTAISLPFFKQFLPTLRGPCTLPPWRREYKQVMAAIKAYADDFIMVNAKYTPRNGALSEQFSKINGTQLSAEDLTWSYASALTAFDAREQIDVESWGAAGLVVPAVCNKGPSDGEGSEGGSSVTFNVNAETAEGQNVFLTGGIAPLKNWSPTRAIPMTSTEPSIWTVTVEVPPDTTFQYKYIKKDAAGVVTWQGDPNNNITSPAFGESLTVDDVWVD